MIFARAAVRLVSFVLLLTLALVGLGVAAAAVAPGGVAELVGLPQLRDTVGGWFDALDADGPLASATALAALGAVLLGLILLAGLLMPRRERLVVLEQTEHGALDARARPLAQVATHLAEQVRGVTSARVRIAPARKGGGRLRVRADTPRATSSADTKAAVAEQLEDLTGPFRLKAAVETRAGEPGSRVQ